MGSRVGHRSGEINILFWPQQALHKQGASAVVAQAFNPSTGRQSFRSLTSRSPWSTRASSRTDRTILSVRRSEGYGVHPPYRVTLNQSLISLSLSYSVGGKKEREINAHSVSGECDLKKKSSEMFRMESELIHNHHPFLLTTKVDITANLRVTGQWNSHWYSNSFLAIKSLIT